MERLFVAVTSVHKTITYQEVRGYHYSRSSCAIGLSSREMIDHCTLQVVEANTTSYKAFTKRHSVTGNSHQ